MPLAVGIGDCAERGQPITMTGNMTRPILLNAIRLRRMVKILPGSRVTPECDECCPAGDVSQPNFCAEEVRCSCHSCVEETLGWKPTPTLPTESRGLPRSATRLQSGASTKPLCRKPTAERRLTNWEPS